MLHNLWLEILPSSIQHFRCPPSYHMSLSTRPRSWTISKLTASSTCRMTCEHPPDEAVPEASQQPEGEVLDLMVVRAWDSPMLLHQFVPHPRVLGSEVAQVVIPVLPGLCVQGPRRLPVVHLVLHPLQGGALLHLAPPAEVAVARRSNMLPMDLRSLFKKIFKSSAKYGGQIF